MLRIFLISLTRQISVDTTLGGSGVYDEEIRNFDARVIRNEYNEELKKEKKKYKRLLGKLNSPIV